jgi:hypothetical protein
MAPSSKTSTDITKLVNELLAIGGHRPYMVELVMCGVPKEKRPQQPNEQSALARKVIVEFIFSNMPNKKELVAAYDRLEQSATHDGRFFTNPEIARDYAMLEKWFNSGRGRILMGPDNPGIGDYREPRLNDFILSNANQIKRTACMVATGEIELSDMSPVH